MNQKQKIAEMERSLEFQAQTIRRFGDELLYFQKQQANVLYEIKLKQYRDKIIVLKKQAKKDAELITAQYAELHNIED